LLILHGKSWPLEFMVCVCIVPLKRKFVVRGPRRNFRNNHSFVQNTAPLWWLKSKDPTNCKNTCNRGTATIWARYTEAAEIGPVDSRMKTPRTVRTAYINQHKALFSK